MRATSRQLFCSYLRPLLLAASTATLPALIPAAAVPAAVLPRLAVALMAVPPALLAFLVCLATDLTAFLARAVGVCAAHRLPQSRSNSSRTHWRAMPLLWGWLLLPTNYKCCALCLQLRPHRTVSQCKCRYSACYRACLLQLGHLSSMSSLKIVTGGVRGGASTLDDLYLCTNAQ